MTQTLGFGQIGFAASELTLRLLCNRNIRHRPDKLDVAPRVSFSTSDGVNVFRRAIRHQQSIFMVELFSVARPAIDGLLHGSAIFRMGALDNKLQGRFRRPITSEDSESLV